MMTISQKTGLLMQSLMLKRIAQRIVEADILFADVAIICQVMNMFIDWWKKLAFYLLETACLYTDGQARPNWADALALW